MSNYLLFLKNTFIVCSRIFTLNKELTNEVFQLARHSQIQNLVIPRLSHHVQSNGRFHEELVEYMDSNLNQHFDSEVGSCYLYSLLIFIDTKKGNRKNTHYNDDGFDLLSSFSSVEK